MTESARLLGPEDFSPPPAAGAATLQDFESKRQAGSVSLSVPDEARIEHVEVSLAEAVEIGAFDPMFWCSYFLPETFSLPWSKYHPEMWDLLDNKDNMLVALMVHRDSGKTTTLRAHQLRRYCYGISTFGLFVSESAKHARRSISWYSDKLKTNEKLQQAYGLSIGKTDNQDELWIEHHLTNRKAIAVSAGITGQIRGLNENDNRPDSIQIDDPCDEENTANEVQRDKISEIVFSTIKPALCSRAINPFAQIAIAQTPLVRGDLIDQVVKDPTFVSARYPIWNEARQSNWPEKWTDEELAAEHAGYVRRHQGHLWTREKECRVTSKEGADLMPGWLKEFGPLDCPPRSEMTIVAACDPVPPPSDAAIQKGLHKHDFEVWTILGGTKDGRIYRLASYRKRGHSPDWSINTFFQILAYWKPVAVGWESVAYQRVMAKLLREEMIKRRQYAIVYEITSTEKKYTRIVNDLTGPCSAGAFYVLPGDTDFRNQFEEYPNVSHDDDLDSTSLALRTLKKFERAGDDDMDSEESEYEDLPELALCP